MSRSCGREWCGSIPHAPSPSGGPRPQSFAELAFSEGHRDGAPVSVRRGGVSAAEGVRKISKRERRAARRASEISRCAKDSFEAPFDCGGGLECPRPRLRGGLRSGSMNVLRAERRPREAGPRSKRERRPREAGPKSKRERRPREAGPQSFAELAFSEGHRDGVPVSVRRGGVSAAEGVRKISKREGRGRAGFRRRAAGGRWGPPR